MSKSVSIAMVVLVALLTTACCEEVKKELAECKEELDNAKAPPAMTVLIEKDGFGTFQPFNNQYRAIHHPPGQAGSPHRDGFLIQLGNMVESMHAYSTIVLEDENGGLIKKYDRTAGAPHWIDIECGETTSSPITPAMAKLLVPIEGDPATVDYRLHGTLDPSKQMTAMTLWAPPEGLQVSTKTDLYGPVDELTAHGHVQFRLTSKKPCEVRVWATIGSAPTDTFAADASPRVASIRVVEESVPPRHGGPHQPGWP